MTSSPPTSDAESDAPSVEATLCSIRDDSEHCSELQVLRHFTTNPIKGIQSSFEAALGIVIDLQFYLQNPKDTIPELEDKLTQVGYTTFPMAALRKCKSPADSRVHHRALPDAIPVRSYRLPCQLLHRRH
jgi:hypothetical protein